MDGLKDLPGAGDLPEVDYSDSKGDGPWCVIPAGELPTGDGVACGRYAPVRVRIEESGEERWICVPCAIEFADAPDRNWAVIGRIRWVFV